MYAIIYIYIYTWYNIDGSVCDPVFYVFCIRWIV